MEKTGCKIICGAPTTIAVKGLMMTMMTDVRDGRHRGLKSGAYSWTGDDNDDR